MASTIFNIPCSTTTPKLHVSHSNIESNYLDPSQPPQKRTPFRQIAAHPFIQSLSICMPQHTHTQLFQSSTLELQVSTKYLKVILSLEELLATYDLRAGNHMMISKDHSTDVSIYLNCGALTLDMPPGIHQRSGFPFQHTTKPSAGRKHGKMSQIHRYVIDLRSPNMIRGKKAFDRLMYAARNVKGLSENRVWLCSELGQHGKKRKREAGNLTMEELLSKHHPVTVVENGRGSLQKDVLVPRLIYESSTLKQTFDAIANSRQGSKSELPTVLERDIYEIEEYLSMLSCKSTRIEKTEYSKVDKGICEYQIPQHENSVKHMDNDNPGLTADEERLLSDTVANFTFDGFMSADFVVHTVVDIIRRSRLQVGGDLQPHDKAGTRDHWVAITAKSHSLRPGPGSNGFTILLQSRSVMGKVSTETVQMQQPGNDQNQKLEAVAVEKQVLPLHSLAIATCFEFVDALT